MSTLAPATSPGPPQGLHHLGIVYDTPADLVEAVRPHLQDALHNGDAVLTMVDRRTARGLRETLGDGADAVTFGTASDLREPRPEDFLRRMRRVTASGRRGWVLAQYSAFAATHEDLATGENGINLVLADQPLTVLCACASTSDAALHETVRDSHSRLIRGPEIEDNPGFRLPADRCPTSSRTWGGAHALRVAFSGTGDLAGIRARMTSLATAVGLRGDDAHAAVFAVHEAVVLACDDAARADGAPRADDAARVSGAAQAGGAGPPGPTAPCVLDVWVVPDRLVAEVRGPRPSRDVAGGPGPGAPRDPWRIPGPLRYVRLFCRDVADILDGDRRTIRIVTGP